MATVRHRLPAWLCALAALGVLAACSNAAPAEPSSTAAAPTGSAPSTASSSLTPPPIVPASPLDRPGPAVPTVVRQDGLGAVVMAGVKLTTSRGPASLDKVGVAGYYLQVCATGETPIDLELKQFALTTIDGLQQMPMLTTGGYTPALKPGSVGAGQCVEGYLTFDLSAAQADAYLLTWTGIQGRAIWGFNG